METDVEVPGFPDGNPVPVTTGGIAVDLSRDANDAFWKQKIAEAEAAGGSIEVDLDEIPPVPGVVWCLPSARVTARKLTFDAADAPVRAVRDMIPSWRDEPGRPPAMASSRIRLTVETPDPPGYRPDVIPAECDNGHVRRNWAHPHQ